MTLRQRDPLRDVLSLQERVNRLFDESLTRGNLDDESAPPAWAPAADVLETAEAYLVELDVPGLERQQIELHAERTNLVVRGERRAGWPTAPERFLRLERSYGSFHRTFAFEHPIDPERVTAELVEGVLAITCPKSGRGQRRIAVERG